MWKGRRSLRFIQRGKLQIQWLPMQFGGGEMNLDPWFSISLCLDCRRMLLRFAWRRVERQANPRLRLRFQVGFWSSFFDSIPCHSNNLARGQEKRRLVRVVALLMGRGKLGNQQPPLGPPQQSAPRTWVIGMPISKWNRSLRLSLQILVFLLCECFPCR